MKKIFLTIMLGLFSATSLFSQTTLAAGEIAIIGLNSDGDDDFSFLLLRDISAGTSIYVTDKGWNDGTGFYTISGDGIWQWSTATALTAGTIVHIKTSNNGVIEAGSLVATPGTIVWVENNTTTISYSGDQIFLYQGPASSPTFITGCHWNVESYSTSANWDGSSAATQTSALPDQLTNGLNAIWLYGPGPTEYDDFRYKCSVLTSGTPSALRAAINNISNWDVDLSNATPYTINPYPCSFTVANPCINPTIPTVTASPVSICPGSSSTLTITGTLNDATAWQIYSGSCGGSSIGSTAGATFSVSPSANTTYYIRGEGGCVALGSCGTVSVAVKPDYNLSETVEVCSGDSYTFPDGTAQSNISIQIIHTSNLQTILLCDSIIQTTVNVNPVYNFSETKSICSGGSYTFPDGTSQNNITAQVIYTSNLQTAGALCDSTIVTTVNVNPVYNLSETDVVCSGGSYTFPDGTTQNNITAQVIHTSNLQTAGALCDSTIVTTVNVNPVYNLTETDVICSGGSYTFPDGTTQNNIAAQVIHTSNLQTVETSCDSIIETTVDIITIDPGVSQAGVLLTANEVGSTYQWLDCPGMTPINGATNQSYTATANGDYAVIVTNNGCIDTSACINILCVGISAYPIVNNIQLYPNPTDGKINIEFNEETKDVHITIRNIIGKTIEEFNYSNVKNISCTIVGSPGLYFIEISTPMQRSVFKLIKK